MLVTCFLPVFNAERYLASWWRKNGKILESVEADLLVVDNASTDSTLQEIEKFKYRKTKIICHSENLGIEGSFRTAKSHIKSKYRILLPADDWLAPEYLEYAVSVMESNREVGVVYGYGYMVSGGEAKRRFHPARSLGTRSESPFFSLLFNNVVPDISLFRSEILDHDVNFGGWFNAANQFSVLVDSQIHFTGQAQCYSGKSPNQLSKTWDRTGRYLQVFLDMFAEVRKYDGSKCWANFGNGSMDKLGASNLSLLRDFFVKAIEINFLTSLPFVQIHRSFSLGSGHAHSGFQLVRKSLARVMLLAVIDDLFVVEDGKFRDSGRFGVKNDILVLADFAEVSESEILRYLHGGGADLLAGS